MAIEVEWDDAKADAQLRRQAKWLSPSELAKAGSAAINRAATSARAVGSRAVRGELALKASVVKDRIKIERATPANVEAVLRFDYSPIPLKEYGARQAQKWVSVRVKKGGGRTKLKKAFIVSRFDGNVFMRAGEGDGMVARGPLNKLYGPSVGSQLEEAVPAIRKQAVKVIRERMEHEVSRRVKRANK